MPLERVSKCSSIERKFKISPIKWFPMSRANLPNRSWKQRLIPKLMKKAVIALLDSEEANSPMLIWDALIESNPK